MSTSIFSFVTPTHFDSSKFLRLLVLVSLISLAAVITFTNYQFFSGSLESVTLADTKPRKAPVSSSSTAALSEAQVRSWRLFGEFEGTEKRPDLEELSESDLSITLLGTFLNKNTQASSAIVSVDGDLPRIVKSNSEITSNVIIKKIFPDRAVISNRGQLEVIKLSDYASMDGAVATKASYQGDTTGKPDDNATRTPKQKTLEKYGLEPVSEGATGYKVTEDAKDLIEKFGLNPGDIILSVNGYPVGDNSSDTLAVKSFQGSGSASVVINQGGSMTTMEYKK